MTITDVDLRRMVEIADRSTRIPQLAAEVLALRAQRHALREALVAAEDVMARYPFSTQILPNGRHPNDLITQIRDALDASAPVGEETGNV